MAYIKIILKVIKSVVTEPQPIGRFLENTELSRVVGFIFHQSKGKSCNRWRDTSYKEMIGQNPRPKVNGTRIFVLFFLLAKF